MNVIFVSIHSGVSVARYFLVRAFQASILVFCCSSKVPGLCTGELTVSVQWSSLKVRDQVALSLSSGDKSSGDIITCGMGREVTETEHNVVFRNVVFVTLTPVGSNQRCTQSVPESSVNAVPGEPSS